MVERCCSPGPLADRSLHLRDITNKRLEDLCTNASEDRSRQLALLLIKKEPQETDCDSYAPGYFLLKQEGAEPILVRKEPFKDTIERVPISSTFQPVSSCSRNARKNPTTNTASSEITASCSPNVDSNDKVTQMATMSKAGPVSMSGTDRQKHQLTSVKNSALPDLPANLTPPLLPANRISAQTISHSRKQCQMLTPGVQQTSAKMNLHTNQTGVPHAVQSQQNQNIQHPAAVAHLGAQMVQLSLHQNQMTDLCSSVQSFQNSLASSDKRVLEVDQNVTPLPPSSTQVSQQAIVQPQTLIPPVPNVTSLGHSLAAQSLNQFQTDLHTFASGQVPVSLSHAPTINRVHLSGPPVHAPVPATQVQPNEIFPSHSQGLNLHSHFATVPHHSLPSSAQPPYSPGNIPFGLPSIPLQSMKSSASQVSIAHTKASSPLEHIPVTTSHYPIMPDPLCPSSDQFFPSPDHASELLQSLPSMPFSHAPIVLTQQEAALEQPSMIQSQLSEQPLQLAPLLTLKELQAAASNQVVVRRTSTAVEIPMSAVNNFEECLQRFPSCPSPSINSDDTESIIGMQEMDPSETNENSTEPLPGIGEHFRVLAKPASNFNVSDSALEQQNFRMNIIKDLQINNEVTEQKQGSDMTGQIWKSNETTCALPLSALSAPASNKSCMLQKVSRRVLEKKTECSECGRVLSNASSLENHMRLHRGERPYTCSQCGKAFPSVRGLNRHVKVHAEEKGYKCDECGRSFVYQFTLTKHKLIHSGDRPFPCKVCGKKFLAKADRATHMRMHTGEKPFFCSQCGKTFKHRVALNMHMQGHRGEKRYVCPHCEKGFVDLGNFKRHKRIHTGEKPFECKECGKRFTQSAHLKKHVNTQHMETKTKRILDEGL